MSDPSIATNTGYTATRQAAISPVRSPPMRRASTAAQAIVAAPTPHATSSCAA
jgi:hypothetical protein